LRACARPNVGFFEQLIVYESFYRNHPSAKMAQLKINGKVIMMPDFYKTKFPDLYKAELLKQLNRSRRSKIVLQTSNKNYINRRREYKEMQKDMDKIRDNQSENQ